MSTALEITGLKVEVEGKEILTGLDLVVRQGETHALMGPNGSGKSTLAYAVAGHPAYEVTAGTILLDGEDVTEMSPDERAQAGLFLAMQYPTEIPGVSMTNFLRTAVTATRSEDVPVREFMRQLKAHMADLRMDEGFLQRNVNEGFSGGEKKRFEILQMSMIRPRIAVLDETDSGLDVDALRIVSDGVNRLRGPDLGVLLITHYTRILRYITPDRVHVMAGGRIVEEGGPELAEQLEAEGYERFAPAGSSAGPSTGS
jgi:Fe-S cluster assembly ATP-binding protein